MFSGNWLKCKTASLYISRFKRNGIKERVWKIWANMKESLLEYPKLMTVSTDWTNLRYTLEYASANLISGFVRVRTGALTGISSQVFSELY